MIDEIFLREFTDNDIKRNFITEQIKQFHMKHATVHKFNIFSTYFKRNVLINASPTFSQVIHSSKSIKLSDHRLDRHLPSNWQTIVLSIVPLMEHRSASTYTIF